MRITKVYTRTGDTGRTRLAGGQSVWKDDQRVEAYGTVDELNAAVGLVRACSMRQRGVRKKAFDHLEPQLRWVQNKLFDIGGLLATAPGQSFRNMPTVTTSDVRQLEEFIDDCQRELQPLREFILPGGGQVASLLHQARTICRRAERRCVALARGSSVDTRILAFLNRLGDALFVWARWVASRGREPELLWERTDPD